MLDTPRHLAAVTSDTPVPARPKRSRAKSVTQAAASGDYLELLISMRTRLAKDVQSPDTPSRDLAALSRRLMDLGKEIADLEAVKKTQEGRGADTSPDEAFDASAV